MKQRVRVRYWERPTDHYDSRCLPWTRDGDLRQMLDQCETYPHPPREDWRYAVYEVYSPIGGPVYVGHSRRVVKRLKEHRKTAAWWPDATSVAVTLMPCAKQANHWERHRIQTLRPLANREWNPRWYERGTA